MTKSHVCPPHTDMTRIPAHLACGIYQMNLLHWCECFSLSLSAVGVASDLAEVAPVVGNTLIASLTTSWLTLNLPKVVAYTLTGCLELSFSGIAMEKAELEERLFIWTVTIRLHSASGMILALKLHQGTRKEKKKQRNFILTHLNPKPMYFVVWFQGYDYHCNNTFLVQR